MKTLRSLMLASAVASVDLDCAKKSQTDVVQNWAAPVILKHSNSNTSKRKNTPKKLTMKFKHPYARTTQRHDKVGYRRAKKAK